MKKLTVLFLTLALCGTMLAGCGSSKSDNAAETDTTETAETAGADTSADNASDKKEGSDESASAEEELLTGLHHITIDVQDYGTITLELDADEAPISVTNFVNLAEEGFYDGLTFHRIISGFMIQGGDPLGMGVGGPGYQFKDEIHPELSFSKPYLLAMANAGPGTNGSQFFITTVETPWLNGRHTIFGEVTDEASKKVVDAIEGVETGFQDRPVKDVVISSIDIEKL